MATSVSTPRIRHTQRLFLVVVLVTALADGRILDGTLGLAAQAAGFVLVVTGTLYRMWASVFIAGRKDVEVVMDGPYGRCRHPLYLGSLVAGLGLALSTRSLVISLGVPIVLAGLLGSAIRREERVLAGRHGDAWSAYAARVPALWPRGRGAPDLPRREVDLTIYRKAFLDAATVLGLWLLLVAVDALRSQGLWPALFRLP